MRLIDAIFKKEIRGSIFTNFFLLVIVLISAGMVILYWVDIPSYSNGNDVLRQYQFAKLETFQGDINTIIVGDSSAGNAIDAELFSELSQGKTINTSLTLSFGLVGSLNMSKQALAKHPEIKNIIIIQTLGIWNQSFSR